MVVALTQAEVTDTSALSSAALDLNQEPTFLVVYRVFHLEQASRMGCVALRLGMGQGKVSGALFSPSSSPLTFPWRRRCAMLCDPFR